MTIDMDLGAVVKSIVDANTYMTLATADPDGRPWVSPVFFASADYRDYYWVSAPDTTHSANLAERPELSIVIFNSALRPDQGRAQAVYLSAVAGLVPEAEVERGLEIYPGPASRGARPFAAADVKPPGPYRLYRARAAEHWILCPRPDGAPCAEHGLAHDHRTRVDLG